MIDVQLVFIRHYGAMRYWWEFGVGFDESSAELSKLHMGLDSIITVDVAPLIRSDETAEDFGGRLGIHPCWIDLLRKVRRYANDRYYGGVDALKVFDLDVAQVAAALADASLSGGLSTEYYRSANDALRRIDVVLSEHDRLRIELLDAEARLVAFDECGHDVRSAMNTIVVANRERDEMQRRAIRAESESEVDHAMKLKHLRRADEAESDLAALRCALTQAGVSPNVEGVRALGRLALEAHGAVVYTSATADASSEQAIRANERARWSEAMDASAVGSCASPEIYVKHWGIATKGWAQRLRHNDPGLGNCEPESTIDVIPKHLDPLVEQALVASERTAQIPPEQWARDMAVSMVAHAAQNDDTRMADDAREFFICCVCKGPIPKDDTMVFVRGGKHKHMSCEGQPEHAE